MALERTSTAACGVIGALMGIGPTLGIILLSLVQSASLAVAHSPAGFVAWGWRLPFWFGAALGVVETLITLRTEDLAYFAAPPAERQRARRRSSLVEVFSRRNLAIFAQTMLIYLGFLFWPASPWESPPSLSRTCTSRSRRSTSS
ncbi:MAG: hypothetical protein K6U14_12040 [Firmicutes bacterium]|nr:hypothetical protein [Alicyclobacillaceae bacterium]MCL6498343.1 hypothetical protein [Bacillota bacterium]